MEKEILHQEKWRLIDQSTVNPHFHAIQSFAIDDTLCMSVGKGFSPATARAWVHPRTIVLGIQDTKLPELANGIAFLEEQNHHWVVRNSGGLAVALDEGVLNLSLIFPDTDRGIDIDRGYDSMWHLIKKMFADFPVEIEAYEIVGSYCPGDYDLSIDGVKFAGISQRRVRNGIAIQIYLDIEGDSKERARLVRQFYALSKQDNTTNFTYPDVNPNVMGTINELIHTSFTVDDVIQMMKQTLKELGAELKTDHFTPNEENVFHKRLEQMKKRNEKIHI